MLSDAFRSSVGVLDMNCVRLLAAFALWGFAIIPTGTAKAQTFEIQVNNTASFDDDYLCWSPTKARVRKIGPSGDDVEIQMSSELLTPASTGAVQFQASDGTPITHVNFAPSDQIDLVVRGDGSWADFFVSGKDASTNQKDVNIVARRLDGGNGSGSTAVMVRVRKDARNLSDMEREKFLRAMRDLHTAGRFDKYWQAHNVAFGSGIHFMYSALQPPLFLIWHRAFLLNIERELQQIDADVTLPYWRFDQPSFLPGQETIFSPSFLGAYDGSTSIVQFHDASTGDANPWHNWRVSVRTRPLIRTYNPDPNGSGLVAAGSLAHILQNDSEHKVAGGSIEYYYHNRPHSHVSGWLGERHSPADPLFFLLHNNVDRGFAHWQAKHDAWNATGTDPKAYHATGAYPGRGSPYVEGSYALDEMWPWRTGQNGWPNGIFFQLPPDLDGNSMIPTPASQIDYLNLTGNGVVSGACYDDIKYEF